MDKVIIIPDIDILPQIEILPPPISLIKKTIKKTIKK